jgi:hypothetical protein
MMNGDGFQPSSTRDICKVAAHSSSGGDTES